MNGFEAALLLDAAADAIDDVVDGDPHRDLHQPASLDFACESKDLRSLGAVGAVLVVRVGAIEYDPGHIGEGFDIVDTGGEIPESFDGRKRGANPRHSTAAFDRFHQRGFFPAHESSGPFLYLDGEMEVRAADFFSQKALCVGLLDGNLQPLNGLGILGSNINVAFVRADGVAGDEHAFQNGMRVAFQNAAIHERAGISFVGIADDKLAVAWGQAGEAPLHPGGEAGSPTAPQTRVDHDTNQGVGRELLHGILDCFVAALGNIIVDRFRIDETAVAKYDAHLPVQKLSIRPQTVVRPDQQFFDGVAFLDMLFEHAVEAFFIDTAVDVPISTVGTNLHEWFLIAHPDTTGDADLDGQLLGFDFLLERLENGFGAGGDAAGGQTHDGFGHFPFSFMNRFTILFTDVVVRFPKV